jgi:hypothetical protein
MMRIFRSLLTLRLKLSSEELIKLEEERSTEVEAE